MKRLAVLACFLGFGGCNGGGLTERQNANVTGAWQSAGTSTANPGVGIDFEMNLNQTNGLVSSPAFLAFGSCGGLLAGGTLTGTVSGNKINLTVSHQGVTLSLTGTVSGEAIAGTYNCETDSGTWTAQKVPLLSGGYDGTLQDRSSGRVSPFIAFMNTNSSYSITGSTMGVPFCFGPMTLSGTQTGGRLFIVGTDVMGATVALELTSTDATLGHLTGEFEMTAGGCAGESGAAGLFKQ